MKMKSIAVFALIALLAISIAPLAEESDATASINNPGETFKFDNMSGGTLKFSVYNQGGSFEMSVSVQENGKEVASKSGIQVAATSTTEVSIPMGDFKSVGTHQLTIVCTPADQFSHNTLNVTVEVSKNILSNWVTYIVIIVVIIVVVVFAYLKIRDSPKKESTMTFEELEAQRKADMAQKSEKKSQGLAAAPKTERQRYLDSKKKQQ